MEDLVKNIVSLDLNFWKDKRVFITGHTGFKGSWLSILLNKLGSEVYGYALEPSKDNALYNELSLSSSINSTFGNILDYQFLKKIINSCQPEIIFHMAAQPLVRDSYVIPLETIQTNAIGTANLLDIVRGTPTVKALVNITTDKCYENEELGIPFKETDPLGGRDPYSASKACSEIITHAFRQSFFLNSNCKIATARAGNVIGGGDWSNNRLIPDMVMSLKESRNIILRNPNSIRPWQHVLDPLFGYIRLAEYLSNHKKFDSAWNFGPSKQGFIDVYNLTKKFVSYWEFDEEIKIEENLQEPYESKILKLDISKARAELNWEPIFDIDETIKITSEWYKNFYKDGVSAETLCSQDISLFLSRL